VSDALLQNIIPAKLFKKFTTFYETPNFFAFFVSLMTIKKKMSPILQGCDGGITLDTWKLSFLHYHKYNYISKCSWVSFKF
jgi:hypothetical protein